MLFSEGSFSVVPVIPEHYSSITVPDLLTKIESTFAKNVPPPAGLSPLTILEPIELNVVTKN